MTSDASAQATRRDAHGDEHEHGRDAADELTLEQQRDLSRLGSSSLMTAGRLLVSRPSLAVHMTKVATRGAAGAVRNDPTLGWLAGLEHIRRVAPGSIMGADWGGLGTFVTAFQNAVPADAVALEIGCGGGRATRVLQPLVSRLYAVDVSTAVTEEARKVEPGARYFVVEGLGENLPDAAYDAVASHDVFVHFELDECARYFFNVRRALRPGGAFVVSVYTLDSDEDRAVYHQRIVDRGAAADARRPRRFRAADYETLFGLFGFAVESSIRTPASEYPEERETSTHLVFVARATASAS
jgi:SAM-dependent methyltransferase